MFSSPGLAEIFQLVPGMAQLDSRPTCESSPGVDLAVVSFGMGSHSKLRFVTRAVPDVKNFDAAGLLADVVEDAVRTKDDLTQSSSCAARIAGANKGKRSQNPNVVKYAPPDPGGCRRVMLGDIGADLLEVRNRRV